MNEFIKLLDKDLKYISHDFIDDTFFIFVHSVKEVAECPFCGIKSSHAHSYYKRNFRDLPIQGNPVVIELRTRRMFCNNPECQHTTFAERYSFLRGSAKQTIRLKEQIINVALETSSVAAAEFLLRNAIKTSKSTICLMLKKTVSAGDKEGCF